MDFSIISAWLSAANSTVQKCSQDFYQEKYTETIRGVIKSFTCVGFENLKRGKVQERIQDFSLGG